MSSLVPIGVGVIAGVLTARLAPRPGRSRTLSIAVTAGAAYLVVVTVIILVTAWRMA